MIDPLARHGVHVLLKGGRHTHVEIAGLVGVSERSVRRIGEEGEMTSLDAREPGGGRAIGRPSKAGPFRETVAKLLAEEPGMLSAEVLRRVRMDGYGGGKSALYALAASLRPSSSSLETRFEGLAGEFSQHDFGQVDVRFVDAPETRVHFFVSRLKYSRFSLVTIVPDERAETLIRVLVDHFEEWGGMPLMAVFDRPKTVALKWRKDGSVTEWNPTFAYVALEEGFGVELCWPRRPNQKGSAENLVKWVKNSFFKARRFLDEEDLEEQLREWLQEINFQRPSRATGVVPSVRWEEEKRRLRPLAVPPASLALRVPVWVGPTAHVSWETNRYLMPPDAAGIPGTLFLYKNRVRIVAGRYDEEFERCPGRGKEVATPEARARRLAAVSGERGRRYAKRQDLLETGPEAMDFLTEIVHRRPRGWYGEVEALHELLQTFGPDLMAQAFGACLREGVYGAEYASHFLHGLAGALPFEPPQTGAR
jgi:transposase